jgi:hypothetical protein
MQRWLLSAERNTWYYQSVWRNQSLEEIWREHAAEILSHWTKRHPGTRPKLWWKYDAIKPRLRLGGKSEPLVYGQSSSDDAYALGIARIWHFTDEADLPRYESEPAYLQRLGMFFPGEKRRVKRSDYNPVFVRGAHDDPLTYWRATVLE